MKHFIYVLLVFLSVGLLQLYAQSAVVATGGNASGTTGSVSYSVGQVAYVTQTGTTGIITQGVQQPYEIVTLSGTQFDSIKVSILAYPNPTKNVLTIVVENYSLDAMSYQLIDMTGRSIREMRITDPETTLNLDYLPTASYVLKILSNNQELKTFKIIKN